MLHKNVRLATRQENSRLLALRQNTAWLVLTAPFLLLPYVRLSERLPHLCLFRKWTGVPCMFCGFTRAFENIAHGHFRAALLDCPAALFLYFGMWIVLTFATALTLRQKSMAFTLTVREKQTGVAAIALILLANWVWRLL